MGPSWGHSEGPRGRRHAWPNPSAGAAILPAGLSVDLLHLADDLLLKDGQDGLIFSNLLEHHSTVELVTHLLEVVSAGEGAVRTESPSWALRVPGQGRGPVSARPPGLHSRGPGAPSVPARPAREPVVGDRLDLAATGLALVRAAPGPRPHA